MVMDLRDKLYSLFEGYLRATNYEAHNMVENASSSGANTLLMYYLECVQCICFCCTILLFIGKKIKKKKKKFAKSLTSTNQTFFNSTLA